jgi:hypothetical protein
MSKTRPKTGATEARDIGVSLAGKWLNRQGFNHWLGELFHAGALAIQP